MKKFLGLLNLIYIASEKGAVSVELMFKNFA